ncbi:MAG: hypothetical protein II567_12915 [Candidatus Riflebacteria bacterium]|nr:hypothetical protein [Candidatus Riflebacteria bacterium]
MELEEIRNYIKSINEDYFLFELQGNKIIFPDYTILSKIFALIFAIVLTYAYYYIATNYFVYTGPETKRAFTLNTAYITTFMFFVTSLFFSLDNLKKYTVIDLGNYCIFNEFELFSFKYKTNPIIPKDIIQIGNNITTAITRFYIKGYRIGGGEFEPDPKTNLFYIYTISFLLKNGKTKNIIIGPHNQDYETSLKLSKQIAEYLNIPLITCSKGNILISREYFNSYKFEETPSEYTKQISNH